MQLSIAAQPALAPGDLSPEPVDGLYVHVPFCFHKCHYCDFYSITQQPEARLAAFVDRVLHEAAMWKQTSIELHPQTVFFGGGTPSLLPRPEMQRLIVGLKRSIDWSNVNEFTIEVNPATAEADYCRMLRDAGVTRLSFGAQSFDERELAALERHHRPDDVSRSLDLARSAGFNRLNIDLIFGVPGQSVDSWLRSLDRALQLGTTHLSCYALTYEPNTPLAVKKRLGMVKAIDESVELEMLQETRCRLAAQKMPAYEVSNFAAAGEACRHNLLYWDGGSYIGLGPSAASHVHGTRWKNRGHLGEWERAIDAREFPTADVEQLSAGQRIGEHAMLRLRLSEGIHIPTFDARWNADATRLFARPIDRYARQGLLAATAQSIQLTEAGVAVADAIAAEFLTAAAG